MLPGDAGQAGGEDREDDDEKPDVTKSEDEAMDEKDKNRKKCGLPEYDPDALPSSSATKYMRPG